MKWRLFVAALLAMVVGFMPSGYAQGVQGGNSLSAYNTASGALTALNEVVSLPAKGYGTVGVQVSGTFTGTIRVECSLNTSAGWTSVTLKPTGSDTNQTDVTAPGIYIGSSATCSYIRARMHAYTSGTANVVITAVSAGGGITGGASFSGTVTVDDVTVSSFPDNEPFNVAQIAGAAPGATNPLPVRFADGTDFIDISPVLDPCQLETKQYFNINGTASATVITGTASKKIYICSLTLSTAIAQNLNLVSGTGTVCATGITAVKGLTGGTTAATGWNFAANGGIAMGHGGFAIAQVQNNADNLCVLTSSSGQFTGGGTYVVE